MIIAISGKSGCGNTTVSRALAERLGFGFVNYTFRSMAQEMGIPFERMLELANADHSYDRRLDETQVRLARQGDNVVGSRLAIWLLKDEAFTVYLKASASVRASRLLGREGGDLGALAAFTAERDRLDHERYVGLYGIDNDDYSFVDLVIDVERLAPPDIVELIVAKAFPEGAAGK
jgi:cytidylate kinase